jgi:hypothetical protein
MWSPTMPSTWQVRKETLKNCTTCSTHQNRRFSISIGHTTNHRYNCNSFFKLDMIASSFDTICPKKKLSSSILVSRSIIVTLTRFKWKNACNKERAHNIGVIIYNNLNGMSLPTKSHMTFMFLKPRSNMIANMLWVLAWL